MVQDSALGERTYVRLKSAVLAGSLNPHGRLDFAELAEHFGVSTTPIREAAMRLLGEGLLEHHPTGGTRPMLVSEYRLRTLIDLHSRLILCAIDWGNPPIEPSPPADRPYEELARLFFHAFARSTANQEFVDVVDRLADRLAPFRRLEPQIIPNILDELGALREASSNAVLLRRALRSYHRRRLAIVAQLVWMANSEAGRSL